MPDRPGDRWTSTQCGAFRFFFTYESFYALSLVQVFGDVPWPWNPVVLWVARHVPHLGDSATFANTGSSDRPVDYAQLFCTAALAAVVTLGWSLWNTRDRRHPELYAGLRVYVRHALGVVMIAYGMAKILPIQFGLPVSRLFETYGESSPMGLLWTFMGASRSYTAFAGAGEIVGGALLLFRRTTTLGTLICSVVLTNVVALNFCYDVPVKLLSVNLLVMALFLLSPDLKRLIAAVIPREARPATPRTRAVAALEIATLALCAGLCFAGYLEWSSSTRFPPAPFGAWAVDAPDAAGAVGVSPWRNAVFSLKHDRLDLQLADGTKQRFSLQQEPGTKSLVLSTPNAGPQTFRLVYETPDLDHLHLKGPLHGSNVEVLLHRIAIDDNRFLLTNRGFHWISEAPFNR